MENKTLPPCATETVDNIQCIHYPGKLQECFDCGIICASPQTEQAEASSLSDLLSAGNFEAYGDLFTGAFKQLRKGDNYKAALILERVAARIRYDESLRSELGI